VFSQPPQLLRLEEACLLAFTVWLYGFGHGSWLLFALLFLAPDLFMLGYLVNPRTGAALYNLGHTLSLPLAIFALALGSDHATVHAVAIIWMAHIAFDRMLGYGLKYPTFFKDKHLQLI
jgi:hypothetical protein